MMITGQKPVKKSKQGRFQVVDTIAMFKPITKFCKQIINANTIPSLVRESFRLAEEERPGAVNLELPEDIAHEYTDNHFIYPINKPRRPAPDIKCIIEASKMIARRSTR